MKTTIFKGIIFGLSVLGLSLSANAEDYVNENSNVSTLFLDYLYWDSHYLQMQKTM